MNRNCSTIERMLETGDGCISRKAAIDFSLIMNHSKI